MTLNNNRAAAHRMLKARQDGTGGGNSPSSPPPSSPSPSQSPDSPNGPSQSNPATTTSSGTTKLTSTSTTSIPTNKPTPPVTTSKSPETTQSSTSSSSSTSSTTSSSTTQTTTTSTSTTSSTTSGTATGITTPIKTTPAGTTSVASSITPGRNVAPTPTDIASISADPTNTSLSNNTSSGISTGAIVGSVAGGIAGIALIALVIAFFLRRWRRRSSRLDDVFNSDEVTPPMDSGFRDSPTGNHSSTFDPTPPSMVQHGHASLTSAGMAGHGAYLRNQQQQREFDARHIRDDEASDMGHGGPYSSEPQPQVAYNPEMYGGYAYSTDGHHTAAQQPYHAYQTQHQQGHYGQYNGNGISGQGPALVAGAPAVNAGRSVSRATMNDDDAYGGI